jgi:hypothetical protein
MSSLKSKLSFSPFPDKDKITINERSISSAVLNDNKTKIIVITFSISCVFLCQKEQKTKQKTMAHQQS